MSNFASVAPVFVTLCNMEISRAAPDAAAIGTFDIVMAKDGKEALDILSSSNAPVGLILTDMWMPVMDGEGLVRAVHGDKNLASIQVYVVTADTEMQGKYSDRGSMESF